LKLIDISMPLQEGMIVYPGDPEYSLTRIKSIPKDSSNLSEIRMGLHTGTHVDAQLHVKNKGKSIDSAPLAHFYGDCQVLDLTGVPFGEGITKNHLKDIEIKASIILLKTRNSEIGFNEFKKDFVFLTEDGAEWLVSNGVTTVGIDYLSIQKFHTGYCASHCVLLDQGVIIFEGLNLSLVKQGFYTFVGFPLLIKGGEAAPARAVLIEK